MPAAETFRPSPEWANVAGVSGFLDAQRHLHLQLEYRSGWRRGPLHAWAAAGYVSRGAVFAGGGLFGRFSIRPRLRLLVGFGPIYYDHRSRSTDLGSKWDVVSYFEVARQFHRGHWLGARLSHVSNAGLSRINPGTETISLTYAIPWLKRTP